MGDAALLHLRERLCTQRTVTRGDPLLHRQWVDVPVCICAGVLRGGVAVRGGLDGCGLLATALALLVAMMVSFSGGPQRGELVRHLQ